MGLQYNNNNNKNNLLIIKLVSEINQMFSLSSPGEIRNLLKPQQQTALPGRQHHPPMC